MKIIVLVMCGLLAVGVFATTFLAVWSGSLAGKRASVIRQRLAKELVWTAIPCLMIFAAAILAALAVLTSAG